MNALDHFNELPLYRDWSPTPMDAKGLGDGLGDHKVLLYQDRDSDTITRSNFAAALMELLFKGSGVELHRFRHWACGWFELILISPTAPDSVKTAAGEVAASIDSYPILDEQHHSLLEHEEAGDVWKNSFCDRERLEYIRRHRSQFEFNNLTDLRACVRGDYFAGYASELFN